MLNGAVESSSPLMDHQGLTGIGIGSDEMVEDAYTNRNIRDRIEVVNDRVTEVKGVVTELKGELRGHEQVCLQLNAQILKDIQELRTYITFAIKVGFWLAILLFGVELGKATFPALFDALLKSVH
jgi:hypothetical protein